MVKKQNKIDRRKNYVSKFSREHIQKTRAEWETEWFLHCVCSPLKFSTSALLDNSFSETLGIWSDNKKNQEGDTVLHRGVCGRWLVETVKFDDWIDFSIKVIFPRSTRLEPNLSPDTIQASITRVCGNDVYESWKQLQLEDLPSLRRLINEFRDVIDYPCMSLTCSENSKRLCERVGLPIYKDWTFLIPNSMVS